MTGRDAWGSDNPERVASEGEAPSDYRVPERDEDADYEAMRDAEIMEGKTYPGILDDCMAVSEPVRENPKLYMDAAAALLEVVQMHIKLAYDNAELVDKMNIAYVDRLIITLRGKVDLILADMNETDR